MNHRPWKRWARGSSLLEVMIAGGIVFTGLVGSALLVAHAGRNARDASLAVSGSLAGASFLDRFVSGEPSQVIAEPITCHEYFPGDGGTVDGHSEVTDESGREIFVTRCVEDLLPDSGMSVVQLAISRKVIVRVGWYGPDGVLNKSRMTLESYVSMAPGDLPDSGN